MFFYVLNELLYLGNQLYERINFELKKEKTLNPFVYKFSELNSDFNYLQTYLRFNDVVSVPNEIQNNRYESRSLKIYAFDMYSRCVFT